MKPEHIIFDGGDGSGKGVQMELLRRARLPNVVFTQEPGGTSCTGRIREILLDKHHASKITPLAEFLLYWAAREIDQQNLVAPMLKSGKHVFSDRCDSSTFAYQLSGEEHEELFDLFVSMRQLVFAESSGRHQPDLYIVFDLPAEVARERALRDTSRTRNHYDERPLEFYQRVREGFRNFAKYYTVTFVDATRTPEEIHRSVLKILELEGIETEPVFVAR